MTKTIKSLAADQRKAVTSEVLDVLRKKYPHITAVEITDEDYRSYGDQSAGPDEVSADMKAFLDSKKK